MAPTFGAETVSDRTGEGEVLQANIDTVRKEENDTKLSKSFQNPIYKDVNMSPAGSKKRQGSKRSLDKR